MPGNKRLIRKLKLEFNFNIFLFLFGWCITVYAVEMPTILTGWILGLTGAIFGAIGLINVTLIAYQIFWKIKLNESTSTNLWTFTITRKTSKTLYRTLHSFLVVVKMKIKEFIAKFIANVKAEVSRVVTIAVSILVAAVIMPVALTTLAGANYTGVDPAVKTVVTILLPILAVIGIAMLYIGYVKRK